MKNEFQDLDWATTKIVIQFKKNSKRSISATFRQLRNHPRLSLIGDYPFLSVIVQTIKSMGIDIKRSNLLYALNLSEELKNFKLKDKSDLLDQLLKPASVQISNRTKRLNSDQNSKADHSSVKSSKKYIYARISNT